MEAISKLKSAIKDLEIGLLKLNKPTYDNIDALMRKIMKTYDVTAKQLHYGFRDKHNNKTPDDWIKSQEIKKMKTFREFLEEAYLCEMRKEDKVRGKKPTPLLVPSKRKTIQRAPEGSDKKWQVVTTMAGNPAVSQGRYRQGAQGGSEYGYERHPHGGEHGGMSRGSERGKKRPKGLKPGVNIRDVEGKKTVTVGPKPETSPVEKFKSERELNKGASTRYTTRSFDNDTYNRKQPTRLDVLRSRRAARLSGNS